MKRTLTADELIHTINGVLAQSDGEFIAEIANLVLAPEVTYAGNSLFTEELPALPSGDYELLDFRNTPKNDRPIVPKGALVLAGGIATVQLFSGKIQ